MPKVSQEYFDLKRDAILDAALSVCKNKPLYQITMKDIIRESGVSQGGIYRYFSDVDEILIEIINRCNPKADYKQNIDAILQEDKSSKDTLEVLFYFLGEYMHENATVIGKFQFELTVLRANQPDRAKKMLSKITDEQSGQYFMNQLLSLINIGIAQGDFHPVMPVDDIFRFISSSIDGIVLNVVLQRCYSVPQNMSMGFDAIKLTKTLAESVIRLLCPDNAEGSQIHE